MICLSQRLSQPSARSDGHGARSGRMGQVQDVALSHPSITLIHSPLTQEKHSEQSGLGATSTSWLLAHEVGDENLLHY